MVRLNALIAFSRGSLLMFPIDANAPLHDYSEQFSLSRQLDKDQLILSISDRVTSMRLILQQNLTATALDERCAGYCLFIVGHLELILLGLG